MVQEISYFREIYPTTNTADFKNSKKLIPTSADNIRHLHFSLQQIIWEKNRKVPDLIKLLFIEFFRNFPNKFYRGVLYDIFVKLC